MKNKQYRDINQKPVEPTKFYILSSDNTETAVYCVDNNGIPKDAYGKLPKYKVGFMLLKNPEEKIIEFKKQATLMNIVANFMENEIARLKRDTPKSSGRGKKPKHQRGVNTDYPISNPVKGLKLTLYSIHQED